MKTFSLLLLASLLFNLSATELQWVDEQINAIKPPRNAVSKSKINSTKNPFIFLNKTIVKKKLSVAKPSINSSKTETMSTAKNSTKKVTKRQYKSLILDAVINKSALINGEWYKLGAKVGKYTLSSVNLKSVLLIYKKKTIVLSTISTTSNKLKFKSN